MYKYHKMTTFSAAFLLAVVMALYAQVSPYIANQHSQQAATPPGVQAAIALSGKWLLEYGDMTNQVTISHITGKIVVVRNAGLLSQRYLRLGDRLLKFKGSISDNIEAVWHIEDNMLEIREGDFAGARMIRAAEDKPDDEDVEKVDEETE